MSVIFGNYTPTKKKDKVTELTIGIFFANKIQNNNDKKNNAFIAFSNNNKFMYGKKV